MYSKNMIQDQEIMKAFASNFMGGIVWVHFKDHVMGEKRYQLDRRINEFVTKIGEMSLKRHRTLKEGDVYYRARVGPDRNRRRKIGKTLEPLEPFKGMEMQVPDFGQRRAGRANAKGIGFLYLSSKEVIAIAEVRPWKGALVSVVEFSLVEDLKVVDLTSMLQEGKPIMWGDVPLEDLDPQQFFNGLWAQIDVEFAKPQSPDDSDISYVPTQIIAEAFRGSEAKGIIYKSAISDADGCNLVLFDESFAYQNKESAKIKEVVGINYKSVEFNENFAKANL